MSTGFDSDHIVDDFPRTRSGSSGGRIKVAHSKLKSKLELRNFFKAGNVYLHAMYKPSLE